MYLKKLGNRKYEIYDKNCICDSSEVIYTMIKTIGEKFWDSDRKCEIILDEEIEKAYCPSCNSQFKVNEI